MQFNNCWQQLLPLLHMTYSRLNGECKSLLEPVMSFNRQMGRETLLTHLSLFVVLPCRLSSSLLILLVVMLLILDSGFWIADSGFWILDSGFSILDLSLDFALDFLDFPGDWVIR